MGHHFRTDKKYIAEHYIRERHVLTLIHKDDTYPDFKLKDENGTEYWHCADRVPIATEQGWKYKPITKFGMWAWSCPIGESIYASFYIKIETLGALGERKVIFDVRMIRSKNKG